MSIYTDIAEIEHAIDEIIEAADEFNDDIVTRLNNLMNVRQDTIKGGMERLAKLRANKLGLLAALKEEISRLEKRATQTKKTVEWVENYIFNLLHASGEKKLEVGSFIIGSRLSKSVWVEPDFNNPTYCRTKTITEPDKIAIKAALNNGIAIDGALLIEKENLTIK